MDLHQLSHGAVVSFSYDAPTELGRPTSWRSDLAGVLGAFEGLDLPHDVVLAAGELVSNGVEHGGGVTRLHVVGRPGEIRVEVEDHRPTMGTPRVVATDSERGRGLSIVDAVADEWGWLPCEGGKMVWARFETKGKSA
jgi:anti-sigma regulatory factor (Ser/Thr protein kinase)